MNDRLEVLMNASVAPGAYMNGYGITLRQQFAAMAMQGILSNSLILDRFGMTKESVASESLNFADALIAALSQPATQQGNAK